jgi:diaminohydroxyphosphoribosylaminopyrimidine deaminase/5-amino-6-(5-phosphoribosylamino)uracil reductase
MKDIHERYMLRCIELARLGAGSVSPNPMVGCVIVHDDTIIGEGWHETYGGPHAEVNAIASVRDTSLLQSATAYVNLEPCSHHGNTPPCADLLISRRVPRVVIAATDDNPAVSGSGIQRLRDHGIEVITGLLSEQARQLNKYFYTYHNEGRPYVLLKWAQSADGFFAPLQGQRWLSNEASRRLTHRLRHDMDAILVGRRTAGTDDPQLTDRYWGRACPTRVIIDPECRLPGDLRVFRDGRPAIVLNTERQSPEGIYPEYNRLEGHPMEVAHILDVLYKKKINSLLVEGGADTLHRFIDAGLWDEAVIYRSPGKLGEGIPAPVPGVDAAEHFNLDGNEIEVCVR